MAGYAGGEASYRVGVRTGSEPAMKKLRLGAVQLCVRMRVRVCILFCCKRSIINSV